MFRKHLRIRRIVLGLAFAAIVVPVAPAGLDMSRWFVLVERDPIVRWLLASPAPLPGAVVRAAVAQTYRRLAFRRPGSIQYDGARDLSQ